MPYGSTTAFYKRKCMKKYLVLLFIASVVFMYSCDKTGIHEINDTESVTFILQNEDGAVTEKGISLNDGWTISNHTYWFSVSPMKGQLGDTEFTVTSLELNADALERVGTFDIIMQHDTVRCYVIQKSGKDSLSVPEKEYDFKSSEGKLAIRVYGNIQFDVKSETEWVKFSGIEKTDSILLSDGRTYSDFTGSDIMFDVEENVSAEERRQGKVIISTAKDKYEISIDQMYVSGGVDWGKDFYRNSIDVHFTGTWCGNCPKMGIAQERAIAEFPDRIIAMNCHIDESDKYLACGFSRTLSDYYGCQGYPASYINNMASISNSLDIQEQQDVYINLAKEAIGSYPANVGISGKSALNGDDFELILNFAIKSAHEYRFSAFLLEDSIVAKQADYGELLEDPDNTVHNSIVKHVFTDLYGDRLPYIGDNEVNSKRLETEFPMDIVRNMDNAYVVVFVSYDGVPEYKGVKNAIYGNYGTIIDNAIIIPINGETPYLYEN